MLEDRKFYSAVDETRRDKIFVPSDLYTFVAGAALEKDTPFRLECNCGGVVPAVGNWATWLSMSSSAAHPGK